MSQRSSVSHYTTTQILTVSVRPGDSGLTVTDPEIENIGEPHDISVTIWGVPASHEHDLERRQVCFPEFGAEISMPQPARWPRGGGEPPEPFLSNPRVASRISRRWTRTRGSTPGQWSDERRIVKSRRSGNAIVCRSIRRSKCGRRTRAAESPTGLAVSLVVPQRWEKPFSIATANLKDTTVALPEGMTINPSAGSRTGGVHAGAVRAETSSSLPGEGCPAGIEDRVDRNRNAGRC